MAAEMQECVGKKSIASVCTLATKKFIQTPTSHAQIRRPNGVGVVITSVAVSINLIIR